MLKEIFHDSFENFEIYKDLYENHSSVTGCLAGEHETQ